MSDEPEADSTAYNNASMQSHDNVRGAERKRETKLERLGSMGGSFTPGSDGGKARFYIKSDEEDDTGDWIILCGQRKGRSRHIMQHAPGGGNEGGAAFP